MKQLLCILIGFCVCLELSGQVTVQSHLEKNDFLIGDYIHVRISVVGDSDIIYAWPSAEEIASFDVISADPSDTLRANGKMEIRQDLIYSVYDSGAYYFPQIAMAYKKWRDTTTYYAFSDSVPFMVRTVPVDTTQAFRPIKGVRDVRVRNYTLLYWIGGFVLLSVIGAVIYLIFFNKEKKKAVAPIVTPVSLYVLTIKRLKELDEKKLWQQDELKLYYSELTDIIRYYMEHRFEINAMESTSEEIIAQLSHFNMPVQQIENIRFVLEIADMAKFAKSKPLPGENTQAFQYAMAFVENTKPAEPETTAQS